MDTFDRCTFSAPMGDKRNEVRLTPDFSASDGECHGENCCGHSIIIVPKLWRWLQALRYRLGIPVVLNSVYRCEKHNADPKVGGAKDSDHLRGEAADIVVPEDMNAEELAIMCGKLGFTYCIFYPKKRIVHASVADLRGRPRIWNGEA